MLGGNGAILSTPTATVLDGGKVMLCVELFFIAISVIIFLPSDIKSTLYKHNLPGVDSSDINSAWVGLKSGATPVIIQLQNYL